VKKIFKNSLIIIQLVTGFLLAFTKKAFAATVSIPSSVPSGPSASDLAKNAINVLLYVAGIASVIVIIVGGIMYVVSGGNPDRTKTAKDAILYAVIGLVISIMAFSIVNFVLGKQGLGR
jgi:hypothetical protein